MLQNWADSTADADAALTAARNETTRTPVATARCKTAFDALTAKMRDMKKRYFYMPPLTEADLVSLGLKVPDSTHTPSHVPTAHAAVETFLTGRHELGLRIVFVDGSPDDPANKGFRVWYKVIAPGETPPANPESDLTKSFFTKRRKDALEFEYGDSGKTAYMAIQIENDGKKGSWGPLVSALIP
ncbi:MAG: hypothetical protein LBK73_15270 [Treponema sp.]|jgi:hypothetical protein|nr:hypothetical protein [Treponema sp.]